MMRRSILGVILLIAIAVPTHKTGAVDVSVLTTSSDADVRIEMEYLDRNTMRLKTTAYDTEKDVQRYSLVRDNSLSDRATDKAVDKVLDSKFRR